MMEHDNQPERQQDEPVEEDHGYPCINDCSTFIDRPDCKEILRRYFPSIADEDVPLIKNYLAASPSKEVLIFLDLPFWLREDHPTEEVKELIAISGRPALACFNDGFVLVTGQTSSFEILQKASAHRKTVRSEKDGKLFKLSDIVQGTGDAHLLKGDYQITPEFVWQLQVELTTDKLLLMLPCPGRTLDGTVDLLVNKSNDTGHVVAVRFNSELLVATPGQSAVSIITAFQLGVDIRVHELERAGEQLMEEFASLDLSLESEVLSWLSRLQEINPTGIDTELILDRFEGLGRYPNTPDGFYELIWDPRYNRLIPYLDNLDREEVVTLIISVSLAEIQEEGSPLSATGLINYLRERDRLQD